MDRMLCRIHCGLKGNEPVLHDFKAREDTLRERAEAGFDAQHQGRLRQGFAAFPLRVSTF